MIKIMLSKSDVVSGVASKTKMTKEASKEMVNAFMEFIKESLEKGESVQLVGFATFTVKKRKARAGRNPATGAKIDLPEKNVVSVKIGASLKDAVNKA